MRSVIYHSRRIPTEPRHIRTEPRSLGSGLLPVIECGEIHMSTRSLALALLSVAAARAAAPDGEALYKQRCAACHDGKAQPRMPSRQELGSLTPEAVYQAMFGGAMVPQSAGLTADEGRAIARFVTAKEFGARA